MAGAFGGKRSSEGMSKHLVSLLDSNDERCFCRLSYDHDVLSSCGRLGMPRTLWWKTTAGKRSAARLVLLR